ncbi:hypothetical protein BCR36DRAFT_322437, partial [Piromyces finnis]
MVKHFNFYIPEDKLYYIYSFPYDVDPNTDDRFKLDSTFRSQPYNGWFFGDVFQDTKNKVYNNILSDPEIFLTILSNVMNEESNSILEKILENSYFHDNLSRKINDLLLDNPNSLQTPYLNKRMEIKDNIYNNLIDIPVSQKKNMSKIFNRNNALTEIVRKKFLNNENHLKKLVYLIQFQMNLLLIVSSKDDKFLKILDNIPKLLYLDFFHNETYNSIINVSQKGLEDQYQHEHFKYTPLENHKPLLNSSVTTNSSIAMTVQTVPKFNFIHNYFNNLTVVATSDEMDKERSHFIDNIISTTFLNSETRVNHYINKSCGSNYTNYSSINFYLTFLEEIKNLPSGALIINIVDKEKLKFEYTLQIGTFPFLNNIIFWPSEGFRRLIYQSWLSNAF